MTESHLLRLPFIEAAQAQKHVTHNEALHMLDALVQLAVSDLNVATPPFSPVEGMRLVVAASGATGAFAGHGNQIAVFQDSVWRFLVPRAGWIAFIESSQQICFFDGSNWQDASQTIDALQNLAFLGLGTQADAQNPFAAKLNSVLFTARSAAEGGDGNLRLAFNKESGGQIVSHLFQSAYSARAEAGLLGNEDYAIKVSNDGSAWHEALRIDRSTGVVNFLAGVTGVPGLSVRRVETFTSSGTFVKQPGDALFYVEMVGGGGGGGSGARNAANVACGGGSGGNGGSTVCA